MTRPPQSGIRVKLSQPWQTPPSTNRPAHVPRSGTNGRRRGVSLLPWECSLSRSPKTHEPNNEKGACPQHSHGGNNQTMGHAPIYKPGSAGEVPQPRYLPPSINQPTRHHLVPKAGVETFRSYRGDCAPSRSPTTDEPNL